MLRWKFYNLTSVMYIDEKKKVILIWFFLTVLTLFTDKSNAIPEFPTLKHGQVQIFRLIWLLKQILYVATYCNLYAALAENT